MLVATSLALLPLGFVALMAARELRPWWRQLQQIRAIPEPPRHSTGLQGNLGAATEAYAAYLNTPRDVLDIDEQLLFDEDLERARAEMERAWLEATPVLDRARMGRPSAWRRVTRRVLALLRPRRR